MIAHLKKLGLREPQNQHKHDTQFLPSFSFFSGPTTKGKSHLNEGIKKKKKSSRKAYNEVYAQDYLFPRSMTKRHEK